MPIQSVMRTDDSVCTTVTPFLLQGGATSASPPPPDNLIVRHAWDNTVRWRQGERLHHLFEQRCKQFVQTGDLHHLAVVSTEGNWSYPQLDMHANQLARYLLTQGYRSGDIIGLLFDKSAYSYIAMLAVLKINAAYVPLDPAFPEDRIAYIAADAGLKTILSLSRYQTLTATAGLPVICVDSVATDILAQADTRLHEQETGAPVSELCYIIYTSGSTGRPKGVPIEQASICNFVRVAAEVYGYTPHDRVYQGLTIAFDFAVEEIWVPLMVGATLLPNQTGSSLLGSDLTDFLLTNRVTAMCCVPTLLATLDQDLPALRLLIVSGEACPQYLISRWYTPQRTILNAYGPTETTVTATLARSRPDEPVTIGKPLPTYTVVILEPGTENVQPFGEEGEIVIAGVGVAQGYLNRPEQTQQAFIPDFLHIPDNLSGLLYRTGDLGVINTQGEIEYRGRIDLQVKIRGYRIELTEIESVILQMPPIAQAVVDTFEPMPGVKELVAYYTLKDNHSDFNVDTLVQALREQLPSYMVPAYYEKLDTMPLMASDKADRKALPLPSSTRMNSANRELVTPRTATEQTLAEVLANLLRLDAVSVEDHFFDDLGASSLLMVQFSTATRKALGQTSLSMRDVYTYPSIASLAAYLATLAQPTQEPQRLMTETVRIPSNWEYYSCGTLQLLYYFLFSLVLTWIGAAVMPWILAADSNLAMYERTTSTFLGGFIAWTGVAIAAKWLLIGKWQTEQIPIWSLRYFRFWVVKHLLVTNPMTLFRGYPLYNLYLRLLGAKIGRNVVMEAEYIPVGTDLLSIGDNSILHNYSTLTSYKARANYIHTGRVNIGANVVVGEGSVIDLHTVMEDDAQLGHASSLHEYQTIPAGKSYHGTPAQETATDFRLHVSKPMSAVRPIIFSVVQLLLYCGVLLPLVVDLTHLLVYSFGMPTHELLTSGWVLDVLKDAAAAFVGLLILGLLSISEVPRLLNYLLDEDRDYVLYGFHFFIFKLVQRLSNSQQFNLLFGDSSYVTHYLQWLGYKLSNVIQTGSNFGLEERHDNPFLCHFGTRTMVSDGLTLLNTQHSSTAFRLSRNAIGDDNFLGNTLFYPVGGRTGNNCLIATKTMVPIDGKLRENIGLLGSPCFEIPRATGEDKHFDPFADTPAKRQGLQRKNFANIGSIVMFLLAGFIYFFITLLLIYTAAQSHTHLGSVIWVIASGLFALFTLSYSILVERAAYRFGRMQPSAVSIYDPEYWRVERMWKFSETLSRGLLVGTPFRNTINRALGVRQGQKVFDDGASITEKTLVELGDYCNLNIRSILQCHSLEQGRFKSDRTRVGNGCTLEPNAFVHYGVTIGDNVLIGPDSFVMKGETLESGTVWRGNPARAVS